MDCFVLFSGLFPFGTQFIVCIETMARHGKELTEEQKEIILSLSNNGFSSYKIQEFTNINSRTIQKFLKRVNERGTTENKRRSGGKKKTTPRDERVLFRRVKGNRRQTLKDLTSRFNNITGCNISERTVRRRLCDDGYRRRVVSKRITISHVNRERRKRFCRQKLTWTVRENWSRVIFSDETKIMLGNNNKIYVWRKPDERLRPECLGEFGDRERTCKASVMFWGCMSYHGVGTLSPVDGNMNTDKYISILYDHLWPVVAQHFPNRPWIFQEDNAPCHVSARANAWKITNNISTLPWPAQSPDLNIIENVWKTLKTRIQRRTSEIKNAEDLKRITLETWTALPLHYIRSLYDSIPRRIRSVIRTKGQITKY